MGGRRLVMLSAYRMPTHYPLMLGEEDTAAWLHAYRALWHPDLLRDAAALPEIADPQDHYDPQPGCVYSIPTSPFHHLPEDWDERLVAVGSSRVSVVEAPEQRPFAGLGLAYAIVRTLCEAMSHEFVLDEAMLLEELRAAAMREPGWREPFTAAARRLLATREVVYPVAIHRIELAFAGRGTLPEAPRLDLVATVQALEQFDVATLARLRQQVQAGRIAVAGGLMEERADAVLPFESQLWNLRQGQDRLRGLLGQEAGVFARHRSAFHPYTPLLLQLAGLSKALLLTFDGGLAPTHTAASVRWPSPDGRQVDAYARAPHSAADPQTFFHLAHYLHETIMHDSAATLALCHGEAPPGPWYADLNALAEFAPVLGEATTLHEYLDQGVVGEYAGVAAGDDFAADDLDAAVQAHEPDPVSRYARHARFRRRLDAAWTFAALSRSLGGEEGDGLSAVEESLELNVGLEPEKLHAAETDAAGLLAARLLASVKHGEPGWLVLNPCAFARRVALERLDMNGTPPIAGPVRAAQRDGDVTRLVVDLPGLGYSWIPAAVAEPAPAKLTLATETSVRNEFFEAELDPGTGALRSFRDARHRANRLGQMLVWQPGSRMKAHSVGVTAVGPALGEVTAVGELVDDDGHALAQFRQVIRAWIGRPVLELRIELTPTKPPRGYPWHAYFASRFAWSEEQATLCRGLLGQSLSTGQQRPAAPDFIDVRFGDASTLIVTGGLPFHQRHGPRMLDTVLIAEGETATVFEFFLGLDRPHPALAAQGALSPAPVMMATKGPPHVGPTGWLAHLDAPNLVMTSLKPGPPGRVTTRLMEVAGFSGNATLRWARPPATARLGDIDLPIDGDGVSFEAGAHDLAQLEVGW